MPRVPPVTTATRPVRSKRSIPLWCHLRIDAPEEGRTVTEHEPGAHPPPGIDTTVASPARVWNYWVGGKDNFEADREAGERVLDAVPFMPLIARYARRFLVSAVDRLVTEYGVRQFLDIGTGLPTGDNTHEVAQRLAPAARIVY